VAEATSARSLKFRIRVLRAVGALGALMAKIEPRAFPCAAKKFPNLAPGEKRLEAK
jgi:hypothetical protein